MRGHTISRLISHILLTAAVLLAGVADAGAQLMRASPSLVIRTGDLAFGSDAAYDPVNDVYLVVIAKEAADRNLSTLLGVFVSPTGVALTSVVIHTGNVNLPRVVHLFDMGVPDAFLVTWADFTTDSIRARTLRYPGVLGGPFVALGSGYGGQEVAYSPTSRIAATVWTSDAAPRTTRFSRLPMPLATGSIVTPLTSGTSARPFPLWNSLNDIAWHRARNEFGILYVKEGSPRALQFARVSTGGVVLDDRRIATAALVPLAAQLAFSPLTGNYLAYWADGLTGRITGAELSADGAVLAAAELPASILGGQLGMSLAYNAVSGTFLLIGFGQATVAHEQIRGIELNKRGAPQSQVIEVTGAPLTGNFYAPRVVGRSAAAEWLIESEMAGGTHYIQIVSTATTGGGSELRLDGCAGPDPFASLGGGTCQNGGWLPPTGPPPPPTEPQAPPPPPPVNGSCATPDPFVSLGGGTCVNGGWLPPGAAAPSVPTTPPPPPAPPPGPSGDCASADPFAALGGGTCYNGGWLPPGMTPPAGTGTTPPSPPSPPAPQGGCTTPDPFSAIPSLIGECRNGGWVPVVVETFTGVIRRAQFGNVWSIQAAATIYEFINELPPAFQVEGLPVSVRAARDPEVVSVPPKVRWYTIVLQ